jgi:hypothetical protein
MGNINECCTCIRDPDVFTDCWSSCLRCRCCGDYESLEGNSRSSCCPTVGKIIGRSLCCCFIEMSKCMITTILSSLVGVLAIIVIIYYLWNTIQIQHHYHVENTINALNTWSEIHANDFDYIKNTTSIYIGRRYLRGS